MPDATSGEKTVKTPTVCIIGGGPAGLMAAEVLLSKGILVELYDAMPSLGRKFLMAGKSGLNLTHAEPLNQLLQRYPQRHGILSPLIKQFDPTDIRRWAADLGAETFVGSSQRVFPIAMKAAPLLRAWLHRLRSGGLKIHVRHCWIGWDDDDALVFITPQGEYKNKFDAVLLALGGGSWPQLGSTGNWQTILSTKHVALEPLQPANCGFNISWSEHIKQHHAGDAVKSITLSMHDATGNLIKQQGDFVITHYGVEGSLIYAFSSAVRECILTSGAATLYLDLTPDRNEQQLCQSLSQPRGSNTFAKHLQRHTGIKGIKAKLVREFSPLDAYNSPTTLAYLLKALPITITSIRPMEEAISSAGGVKFAALDKHLMIKTLPGVFCAGEMLDWEAPTGGYLFTACFATGYTAGHGIADWLKTL